MIEAETVTGLTTADVAELLRHEAVIERGLATFLEVGRALMVIRDQRLYRGTHGSFDEYCKERWSIKINYANKLIRAVAVIENLAESSDVLPTNEHQARILSQLEPEQQREVWAKAVANAPDGKVIGTDILRAIKPELVKPDEPEGYRKSARLQEYEKGRYATKYSQEILSEAREWLKDLEGHLLDSPTGADLFADFIRDMAATFGRLWPDAESEASLPEAMLEKSLLRGQVRALQQQVESLERALQQKTRLANPGDVVVMSSEEIR